MSSVSSVIHSFYLSATSIIFTKYSCNNRDCIEFNLSRLSLIESIKIDNDCFKSVQTFKIDGLNRLKTLKIGNFSFTQIEQADIDDDDDYEDNEDFLNEPNTPSKSFYILNCESLESIQIGRYSFSGFGGEFELKNLPQLQYIHIGTVERKSCNFYYSSFVIQGIELMLNIVMIRSSKSTIHYF